ncbi:MAG: hypothetical protein ABWK01_09650 [Infirmifilum sp.]
MQSATIQGLIDEAEKIYMEAQQKLSVIAEKISSLETSSTTLQRVEEISSQLAEARKTRRELKSVKAELKNKLRGILEDASSLLKESEDKSTYENLEEYIDDAIDDFESMVEDLEDRIEEVIDRLKDSLSEQQERRRTPIITVSTGEGGNIRFIKEEARIVDEALREVDRIIRDALSGLWSKTPSTIISSVRLPQADLNVIDLLVEAGIFKSRNEGIAFFVHKGIESSRDWLEKVRSKIEEIKKLQEETRKELEQLLRGEEEKK